MDIPSPSSKRCARAMVIIDYRTLIGNRMLDIETIVSVAVWLPELVWLNLLEAEKLGSSISQKPNKIQPH